MSSTEDREARQKRRTRSTRRRTRNGPNVAQELLGPSKYKRQLDPWCDDFTGEDPHDSEYFQDHELDFNE